MKKLLCFTSRKTFLLTGVDTLRSNKKKSSIQKWMTSPQGVCALAIDKWNFYSRAVIYFISLCNSYRSHFEAIICKQVSTFGRSLNFSTITLWRKTLMYIVSMWQDCLFIFFDNKGKNHSDRLFKSRLTPAQGRMPIIQGYVLYLG